MLPLETLLELTAARHSHLCPRQVLGVRMGLRAAALLGLDLPQQDKRLFTFMETDGCAADGVSVATGCWVGRRTMRIVDYGKVAATFVDTLTGQAFRVWPNPDARNRAAEFAPPGADRWHAQLFGYQSMPDALLLVAAPVALSVSLAAIISQPGLRAVCEQCGEEIMNAREQMCDGRLLCQACAGSPYYRLLTGSQPPGDAPDHNSDPVLTTAKDTVMSHPHPPIIGIVGRSGVGKTTFLEKLLPELKRRGYRVGTIKHHAHPGFEIDRPGKDTWRHAQAGSDHVVIAAPDRVAAIRRVDADPPLDALAATMTDVDVILTEGYLRAPIPKIELVRTAHNPQPICDPAEVLGYVTDAALQGNVPCLHLDDAAGAADLIEAYLAAQAARGDSR